MLQNKSPQSEFYILKSVNTKHPCRVLPLFFYPDDTTTLALSTEHYDDMILY